MYLFHYVLVVFIVLYVVIEEEFPRTSENEASQSRKFKFANFI